VTEIVAVKWDHCTSDGHAGVVSQLTTRHTLASCNSRVGMRQHQAFYVAAPLSSTLGARRHERVGKSEAERIPLSW